MCTQPKENESRKKDTANPSLSARQSSDRITRLEDRVTKLQRLIDIQEEQKDSLKKRNSALEAKVKELLSAE